MLFSALLSAMFSSSSSSARSVRKADENNNAGQIDSAEDKRARLDSNDDEAVASNVGAQRSVRNARDRIRYETKQDAAAKQETAAQRSARNERDRIKYKANTQARVAEQKAVSRPSPGPHQPWPGRTPMRTRPTIWHGRPAMSADASDTSRPSWTSRRPSTAQQLVAHLQVRVQTTWQVRAQTTRPTPATVEPATVQPSMATPLRRHHHQHHHRQPSMATPLCRHHRHHRRRRQPPFLSMSWRSNGSICARTPRTKPITSPAMTAVSIFPRPGVG